MIVEWDIISNIDIDTDSSKAYPVKGTVLGHCVNGKSIRTTPDLGLAMNDLWKWLKHGNRAKGIKEVIFNNPATIIVWQDGTKTVVKCQDGDRYDKEKGFLLCYLKGVVGNKTLLKELDRWVYGEQS